MVARPITHIECRTSSPKRAGWRLTLPNRRRILTFDPQHGERETMTVDPRYRGLGTPLGVGIGAGLGIVAAAMLHSDIAMGIVFGAALGAAVGTVVAALIDARAR
jgi:hypothetical protein